MAVSSCLTELCRQHNYQIREAAPVASSTCLIMPCCPGRGCKNNRDTWVAQDVPGGLKVPPAHTLTNDDNCKWHATSKAQHDKKVT